MKHFMRWLRRPLRNERGEITFFACFFVVGVVMLISFLLLYASVRINCINIRNGAKMELNNLSATIYADTYRSQRETNFEEYLRTLYSSSDYTEMLESTVAGGLASKIPLSTDNYQVSGISLKFNVVGDRVEYIFYCDVEFYVRMFGHNYRSSSSLPLITAYLSSKGRYMSKMLVMASWSPPLARRSICSNVISVHPLDALLQLPNGPVIHRGRTLIRQSQLHADHIEWALVQYAGKEHIPFPLV